VIDHNGASLPSVYVFWWLLLPLMVICTLWLALHISLSFADHDHEHWMIGWLAPIALLAVTIGPAFGYWPWKADYHHLQPATGIVKAVDSRFLAASQYVVVTYDTGLTVRCDDSRCATVRPGDQLRLLCTKEHQFGSPLGADGWGCRWGEQ
jgi:hypothetical protein